MTRTPRFLVGAAIGVLLAGGALTACSGGPSDPAPGEARLLQHSGTVEVSTDGRTWRAANEETLRRGDRVRARDAGRAVLALAAGARVELREGSQVAVGRPLRLVAGDLLVRAGDDDAVAVDASSAVASVSRGGDARLVRGLALDTGVYDGRVDLRSGSRTFRVPALRQVSVAGVGLLPTRAQPLKYRSGDAWDREFLGDWIDLGNDLEARSTGLSGQIGADQGRTAGFYRLLLPALDREPAFTQDLVDAEESLPPGERLVGAAIASTSGRDGAFVDRWHSVFQFRAEGAAWGLVALDQRIKNRPALVSDIDAALSRAVSRPDVVAAAADASPTRPGPGSATPPATSPPATTGGGGSSPSPSTTTPRPSTPPTTAPVVPILPLPTLPPPSAQPNSPSSPSPPSNPAPSGDTLGELTDTLVDTVGGLLGGLAPPSP